jgi:hypothetical protein
MDDWDVYRGRRTHAGVGDDYDPSLDLGGALADPTFINFAIYTDL